jgi:cystathionine beta-lyase
VVPVAKASTVLFRDMAHLRQQQWVDKSGYTYGLHGTPTTFTLEARLASLEGAQHVLLTPSGLSAIAVVDQALLSAGEHLLIPDNAYAPNKALARHELARWGIAHGVYDPMDPVSLKAALQPNTRLVWLEAPGSVTMEFPDLRALVRTVREAAPQAVVALDNTWGAGLAFAPFYLLGDGSLGVDVSIHALTKYPSGGGDVLMGSVMTRDAGLHMKLKLSHMRLGLGVGANDAETVLRSLPSIGLRYRAHDEVARRLARWLDDQAPIAQVLHPALPSSPGHAHWKALCGAGRDGVGAAAGLFSVIVDPRYTQRQVDALCDGLRLFKLGYSWGGPISLVVPYDLASMRSRPQPHLRPGTLVRFSIGLETFEDLQADLAQAMHSAFGDGRG